MKPIATNLGRIVSLFQGDDSRPRGGMYFPAAIQLLKERYVFAYVPDLRLPWEEVQKSGLRFQLGQMVLDGKSINITDFTVHEDGLVVNAWSTDDATIFLKDFFSWASSALGITSPVDERRLYLSQVTVEFDYSVNSLLLGFDQLSRKFGDLLKTTYGITEPVEMARLALDYDHSKVPSPHVAPFSLDRRANEPFARNRFFSEAPLQTREHFAFLEMLESVFGGIKDSKKK